MAPGIIEPKPAVSSHALHSLQSTTELYDDTIRFYLNGTKVAIDSTSVDPEITLLEYLRGIGLTGTKLGGSIFQKSILTPYARAVWWDL